MENSEQIRFLRSALTEENPFIQTNQVRTWLARIRGEIQTNVTQIPFSELEDWSFDNSTGNLRHHSGKFFSIEGLRVETNWGVKPHWKQPIINQAEIGFLGIIAKEFNGLLYFLMQVKAEPGNINVVQLSPTLQATRSNYTRVHQGVTPLYLEYFNCERRVSVLLDQLQSEQGARFFRKRNRNMIVEVHDDIEVYDNFCWLTLGQIQRLIESDNLVNMDSRTVISGIRFGSDYDSTPGKSGLGGYSEDMLRSALSSDGALHSIDDVISWVTIQKTKFELLSERIPLKDVDEWRHDQFSISHHTGCYFSVIATRVRINNREVKTWTQPLVKPAQEGLIAFIVRRINGVSHFLVQAKVEAGNLDIVEMAPTVQCITGNFRDAPAQFKPPFLDFVLNAPPGSVRHSSMQSEEGGRFFKEQNHNLIVEAGEDFPVSVPDNYIWMTLRQLKGFVRYNNYLNIQARSLLACVNFFSGKE